MDDGTERLRGQLRDAAQGGRSGEDYGGDRIEDTAANIPRQAVRGAEEMARQIQHKREKAQDKTVGIHYPQPEETVSEQPLDVSPNVSDSKAVVEDFPTAGPQPWESNQTPPVRAKEPAVPQTTGHPPIKEKTEQISVAEKSSVTARVSQDGPAVKTKKPAVTTPVSQDVPHSIHHPKSQAAIRPPQQVKAEQLRDSSHAPSIKVKEPAAPKAGTEHLSIKEKAEQISAAEKPAVTARVSQDEPAAKTKEPVGTTPVSQDVPSSTHRSNPQPAISTSQQVKPEQTVGVTPGVGNSQAIVEGLPAADPQPMESNQRPPVRARKPAAAESPSSIKEKVAQPSISEKPAFTTRVHAEGQSVKVKERTVLTEKMDIPPKPLRSMKYPADRGKETALSVAPENGTIQTGPAVSHQIHTEISTMKEHKLTADIKTRPDISQFPIRTREAGQAAEAQIQLSAGKPHTTPPDVCVSAQRTQPKRIYAQSTKTVRETGFSPSTTEYPSYETLDCPKQTLTGTQACGYQGTGCFFWHSTQNKETPHSGRPLRTEST